MDLPQIMSSLDLSDATSCAAAVVNAAATPPHDPEENEDMVGETDEADPTRTLGTGSGRNRLSRASKSDCLLRINRRVSMKPQRKNLSGTVLETEEDVRKFYLNQKNIRPKMTNSPLETIFEEPALVRNELKLVGLRKIKRTITFKDGVTTNKSTVQSRRKKIKTLLGVPAVGIVKRFKKLSMDAFLQHLQGLTATPSQEPEEVATANTSLSDGNPGT